MSHLTENFLEDIIMKMKEEVVIIAYCRTPFGNFGGSLKDIPATELGALVIKELLKRSGIKKEEIDYVIFGMAIQTGAGPVPTKQAMEKAELPHHINYLNIANACSSALRGVAIAKLLIETNEADIVIVGGMENMSSVPYLLKKARWGYRLGADTLLDGLHHDGLVWPTYSAHMGVFAGWVAKEYGISREEQDRWALRSHQRAVKAWEEGKFNEEVIPVTVPQKKGEPFILYKDEPPRPDTSYEKIASLPPVFEKDGPITAGNSPGLNDGAAGVILTSLKKAKELGIKPLAKILSCGCASDDPKYISRTPAFAIQNALKKINMKLSQMELIEINEAFAVVPLISGKILGIENYEIVNVNGGAVALGHPVSASGIRILGTLVLELKRRGLKYGVCGICGAGSSGDAAVVEIF